MLAQTSALPCSSDVQTCTPPQRSEEAFAFLNHLRIVALSCRAKPRTNLFEACAILSANKTDARIAYAEALMRCLSDVLGKAPVLYRPGTDEVSFDEAWLMRLAKSLATDDNDSATFLLASRIKDQDSRHLRFLIGSIAECFSLN